MKMNLFPFYTHVFHFFDSRWKTHEFSKARKTLAARIFYGVRFAVGTKKFFATVLDK